MNRLRVVAVYSPGPDAVVGVQLAPDGQNVAPAVCTGLPYAPRAGDQVDVEFRGADLVVTRCWTPGRAPEPTGVVPQVVTVDTPPGEGWSQVTAWSKDDSAVPTVQLVRSAPPVPPPAGSTPVTVSPLDGIAGWASYDPTNRWGQRSPAVRQGAYPGLGAASGLFFYGAGAFAFLAGKTVDSATVSLVRDPRTGTPWSAKTVYVAAHAYPAQPGDGAPVLVVGAQVDLAVDESVRLELVDTPVLAALQDGSAAGIGITSPLAGDYLALLAAGGRSPYSDIRCGDVAVTAH